MKQLIDRLHRDSCSLVVCDAQGQVTTYSKPGVRDLEDLLDHHPEVLRKARIADKVIGKAAAGMAAYGGVIEVYADVMSRKALPLLDRCGIKHSCGQLVDAIITPQDGSRCPLEQIVASCDTPESIVQTLRQHFRQMRGGTTLSCPS